MTWWEHFCYKYLNVWRAYAYIDQKLKALEPMISMMNKWNADYEEAQAYEREKRERDRVRFLMEKESIELEKRKVETLEALALTLRINSSNNFIDQIKAQV